MVVSDTIHVPLSVFLPLSAVYSSMRFLDLFHPRAAYKILLSGGFPANQPPQLIAASYPPRIRKTRLYSTRKYAGAPSGAFKVLLQLTIRHTHQRG